MTTGIAKQFSEVAFERYADDVLAHCSSLKQAERVLEAIKTRLQQCRLLKTRIVYCKDVDRKGSHEHERFDFLGFTFRPRLCKNKWGKHFVNFLPAISDKAIKEIQKEVRSWRMSLRSDKSITDLARMFNAQVQGWINYYGSFYKSAMVPFLKNIERILVRWAQRKYKRLRRHKTRAARWLGGIAKREPRLFAHWRLGIKSMA